jgi:hypothetical protein
VCCIGDRLKFLGATITKRLKKYRNLTIRGWFDVFVFRMKALGKFGAALGLTYIFGVAIVFPNHSIAWEFLFIIGLGLQGLVTT